MKKLLSVIVLLAVLTSSVVFISADGIDGPKQIKSVKVAINAEYTPFEYYENGELKGFEVDLMNAISEKIGCEIEYVDMKFSDIIPAVAEGKVDCGISVIADREDRQELVDFSRPYLRGIITQKDGENIKNTIEFYSIVFEEGVQDAEYKSSYPTEEEMLYLSINDALGELIDDGFIDMLIEKHELNRPFFVEEGFDYEYDTIGISANEVSLPYSDWAAEDVVKAKSLNIIDGNYNFTEPITREEFCEIVYSYICNVLELEDVEYNDSVILDSKNKAVEQLVYRGIIEGKKSEMISQDVENGSQGAGSALSGITFAPDDYLTREEAAAILQRLVNKTIDVPVTEMYFEFDDSNDISEWAESAVQIMCNMRVMKGVGDNNFAPKELYTTEQAIVTVVRVHQAQSANSEEHGGGTPGAYTHDFNYKINQMMPEDKNYMFSPLSVKMAFAMVANGAEGETKQQLLDALDIESLDEFNDRAKTLMSVYNSTDILKLNIANSLWINEDRMEDSFSRSFRKLTNKYYNAEASVVDNKDAVSEINKWASEQTFGKIPDIISNSEFELMLVNALYFKGSWLNDFNKFSTKRDIFTSRDGSKSEIDFMRQTDYFHYSDIGGKSVVELPYKSRQPIFKSKEEYLETEVSEADISMYLIQGEYDMHTDILKGFAENKDKKKTYVALKMPKFEFEFQTGLNDIMKSLGATKVFDEYKAELSPMVENGGQYYIENSLQKTYIKVDEEGTEAAAVTVAAGGATAAPQHPEPIDVTFDEPFTFVIYDNANCEVLFIGEYAYSE